VQVNARLMGLPRQDSVRPQRLSIELLSVVYDWTSGWRHQRRGQREASEGEQASALSRQDRRVSGDTSLETCMK
jgi:hypothetical protein